MKALPSYILAIDPSIRACGVARLASQRIVAETLRSKERNDIEAIFDIFGQLENTIGISGGMVFIIEQPVLLEDWTQNKKAGVAKLLKSFGAYLTLGRYAADLWTPTPQEWKGQLPKSISHARALSVLTEAEISYDIGGLDHNALDAVALIAAYLQKKGYVK